MPFEHLCQDLGFDTLTALLPATTSRHPLVCCTRTVNETDPPV